MIEKGTQIRAVCGGCLDYDKPKLVVDVHLTPQPLSGDIVSIVHRCPACGKLSKASYKHFSDGPLTSENGYQVKP